MEIGIPSISYRPTTPRSTELARDSPAVANSRIPTHRKHMDRQLQNTQIFTDRPATSDISNNKSIPVISYSTDPTNKFARVRPDAANLRIPQKDERRPGPVEYLGTRTRIFMDINGYVIRAYA